MYDKTVNGFRDIWNPPGLDKCYQPRSLASVDNSHNGLSSGCGTDGLLL